MALRSLVAASVAALVLILALSGGPGSVSAHEHRTVAEKYEFVVGWNGEPAIGGQPNAVWVGITLFEGGVPEITEENEDEDLGGVPVEDASENLKVTVSTGGGADSIELPLEPSFGEPGAYVSTPIIPAPGDYAFAFSGTLPDGTAVDETFESGPDTFDTVDDPAELQFPAATAAASDTSSSSDSDDDTGTIALVVALVAVVAAAVAVILGLVAFTKKASS